MTVTCPVCLQVVPARPIEVIARGQRQRLRPQQGRCLGRVEVAEHDSCLGAGHVVALGDAALTVDVEVFVNPHATDDYRYYARIVDDRFGLVDGSGPDRETARAKALERYGRVRLGVDWATMATPPDALNPRAGQIAMNAHRFALWRHIGPSERIACWIMLNPSTADATHTDATLRKVCKYSRSWGYGWVTIGNLWPYRATQPAELHQWIEHESDRAYHELDSSDRWVRTMAERADLVIVAWGEHGRTRGRGARMLELLAESGIRPHALALTQDGAPRHPLYLPASLNPRPLDELLAMEAA